MKKRSFLHEILFYAVILVAIVVVLSTLFSGGDSGETPTYDDVVRHLQNGEVTAVEISPKSVITITFTEDGNPKTISCKVPAYVITDGSLVTLIEEQIAAGNVTSFDPQPATA